MGLIYSVENIKSFQIPVFAVKMTAIAHLRGYDQQKVNQAFKIWISKIEYEKSKNLNPFSIS